MDPTMVITLSLKSKELAEQFRKQFTCLVEKTEK